MMFTRTIRRKMVCGLALVLVMLVTLSLSGISGLTSYRNAVEDWDFSINRAPRRADLSDAIGGLFEPLLLPTPRTSDAVVFQRKRIAERLAAADKRVNNYRERLDALPPTEVNKRQAPLRISALESISQGLAELSRLKELLSDRDPKAHAAVVLRMLQLIGHLETVVQRMPDYRNGLNETLTRARGVYQSRFVMVCIASAIVFVLFLMLVRYGYSNIFSPLRKLHQGAVRVSHGDFDYRLKLNSADEMGELADAFNQMTNRFQEITCDLDRQVRERCKQLVRSERLAGIGFLAAGVAHEINNPLQAIGIAGESLLERTPALLVDADEADRQVFSQYLTMIQTEAERCQQITRKLLDFARGQDETIGRIDLTQIIDEVLAMIRHMSKFRDRVIEFSPTTAVYVTANGPEIKQVVLNLVSNALEAMESGQKLKITLSEQTDQVLMQFDDEGVGMSSTTLDNLFEPFYTQRKDGKGTGLGMSISQRIIGDHGGTIEAHSDGPGHGSTFLVHLPRRPALRQAA